jgi:DNA-binding Lrp family transcriptional regulator
MISAYILNLGSHLWGKKWRMVIMYTLRDGPMRFSQIKTHLPGCSVKVLSECLQELEQNKIILRKQYSTIPVKVTYELYDDMGELMACQVVYRKALAGFFLTRAADFELSEEVIRQLKEEQLTAE